MARMNHRWSWAFSLGLCSLLLGCPSAPPPAATESGAAAPAEATASTPPAAAATTSAPPVVPQMSELEPFTPPALEELDTKAKWFSQPVEDAMELLRKYKADHPTTVTVEQALALENTSPENNQKILEGLGRMPQSDDEVDWDATLNQHTAMNVNGLNPLMASSVGDIDVLSYTGLSLTTIDWNMRSFADKSVVKSWQTSEDRMYDKFVIRDDLLWTDGKPVTAHDFAFSFRTIMNPKVPVPAVRSGPDQLRWVHAYDDQTVVIFHKESLATNTGNISFPVIPRHIFESTIPDDPTLTTSPRHVELEQKPITAGPYRIAKFERDKEVVLERRDEWFLKNGQKIRDKPYFKTVRLKIIPDDNTALLALKNGDIDTLELRPEPWMTQTNDKVFYKSNTKTFGTEWSHSYIGWNMGRPYFSDARVRRAMSCAINHDEIIKNICYNLYAPGQGIYHPTAWMAPQPMPEPYKQDLDKAETLLEEAGWKDTDDDGILDKVINGKKEKFEFSLQYGSGSKVAERICGMVSENLKQIGIICNVKPTEFTVLQADAKKHNFDAMCAGWGSGADPDDSDNLWTTKALKNGGRNYVQYSNPKVDELFEAGKREFDRAKRADIYRQIATILWEDQPYTWLYYRSSMYAFSKSLRGYMYSPRGPFHYSPGISSIWKARGK